MKTNKQANINVLEYLPYVVVVAACYIIAAI